MVLSTRLKHVSRFWLMDSICFPVIKYLMAKKILKKGIQEKKKEARL